MASKTEHGVLVPFPPAPGTTEPDTTGSARLPPHARGFDDIAASVPTYGPPGACAPPDYTELRSRCDRAVATMVQRYLDAGWRARLLPGRLDLLSWIVEDIAGATNAYAMPIEEVETILHARLPAWAHAEIGPALAKVREGSHYEPDTEAIKLATARVAAQERAKKEREEKALAREIDTRKAEGETPARMGRLVLLRASNADRTKPAPWGLHFAPFPDGSDGAFLPLGPCAGIRMREINGVAGDMTLTLVAPDWVIPAVFTRAELDALARVNTHLIAPIAGTIKSDRQEIRDASTMAPDAGVDPTQPKGRFAISFAKEELRAKEDELFNPNVTQTSAVLDTQRDTIERITRGLRLDIVTAAEVWIAAMRSCAARRGFKIADERDQVEFFYRRALKCYERGDFLSPGELLPQNVEEAGGSGDAWIDCITPLLAGRNEVRADDIWLALRGAGLASVITNLVSGRLTRTMSDLGWEKRTLVADGKPHKGYARKVDPAADATPPPASPSPKIWEGASS